MEWSVPAGLEGCTCNSYPQERTHNFTLQLQTNICVANTQPLLRECSYPSCMRKRLLQYIPDEQFGFVPNTGTADVGVAIADEIAIALEAREELRGAALDLKGAFHRVWWRELLAHLWAVGIS